ncbi:hypothetical protein HY501_01710 [Candidatus Woesearchaeota archaeon]|nr:hypothetical protein [Candidatus Woesearchaeota archaeon]
MVLTEGWFASVAGPEWFFGMDAVLQLFFGLIAFFIALKGEKIYRQTRDRKYKSFSLSFTFIGLAQFILALSHLALSSGFYDGIVRGINFANLFFLAHVFFTLVGYTLLLTISLKLKSRKLITLLFAFILLFTLFSYQYFVKFHVVLLLLTLFMALQFYQNYAAKRKFNSGLVFMAFYFIMMSELFFLSSVYFPEFFGGASFPSFYPLGYFFQLVGYLSLLYMFKRVLKNA